MGPRIVNTITTNKGARKMTKKEHKYFVYDVPATMRYKVYAENEIEAKQLLIEQAGWDLKGEPIFDEDDLRKAEPINNGVE
jgi:hypothetical protein